CAANGPWMASVVDVRKYDLYGRTLFVCQSWPWERDGLVLAGETWTSLASSKTICMDATTEELSEPTTTRTATMATSMLAFCWQNEGWAWTYRASILKVTPSTNFSLVAVLTARSAEYMMPRPGADRSPVSGASTPM